MKLKILVICSLIHSMINGWISVDEIKKMVPLPIEIIGLYNDQLDRLEKEVEASWGEYYHVFSGLINKHNFKNGVEIGVSTGGHSDAMLKQTNIEILYSIDPWRPNPCLHMSDPHMFDILYLRVASRLKKRYGDRSVVIRDYSYAVAHQFADGEFDFVFIDGDHNYEAVKQDLEDWYRTVRSGGIIGGDDYATSWAGVPQAVNEFFAKLKLPIEQDAGQPRIWWVIKP